MLSTWVIIHPVAIPDDSYDVWQFSKFKWRGTSLQFNLHFFSLWRNHPQLISPLTVLGNLNIFQYVFNNHVIKALSVGLRTLIKNNLSSNPTVCHVSITVQSVLSVHAVRHISSLHTKCPGCRQLAWIGAILMHDVSWSFSCFLSRGVRMFYKVLRSLNYTNPSPFHRLHRKTHKTCIKVFESCGGGIRTCRVHLSTKVIWKVQPSARSFYLPIN